MVNRLSGIAVLLVVSMLSSCVGIRAKKHTYIESGGTVEVGGAEVGIDFRPEGTKGPNMMLSAMVVGGGFATFDGPFKWRIEALGKEGVHERLAVHRIRTKTARTRRDEWYPREHLGGFAKFKRQRGQAGVVRARYTIPGLLRVKPDEDGRLDVWVDLSVSGSGVMERRTVRFALDPAMKRADDMIFLPVEVVESIGKDFDEMDDPMWD